MSALYPSSVFSSGNTGFPKTRTDRDTIIGKAKHVPTKLGLPVDYRDCEVESLREELELLLYINQPVNQYSPHLT